MWAASIPVGGKIIPKFYDGKGGWTITGGKHLLGRASQKQSCPATDARSTRCRFPKDIGRGTIVH